MVDLANALRRFAAGTHAIVDLDAYRRNIQLLRAKAPRNSAFMAVVKSDAYGHGAIQCALAVESIVDWFGVARIQEALALRYRGVRKPILVLGPPNIVEVRQAIENDITLTVGTDDHSQAVASEAGGTKRAAQVHLKIDTGMRRYGFRPAEAVAAAVSIERLSGVTLSGVYTHFSSADETDELPTRRQISDFDDVVTSLRSHGIAPKLVHFANSAAILTGMTGTTNLVRSGIATYGISPSAEVPVTDEFRQIMCLRTTVSRSFSLNAGDGVSYGLTYRATGNEQVAATAAGYADGLPRQLSNTGWFARDGARMPILGRVCMDQTVVSADDSVRVGDCVEIIGAGENGEMTLDDVARIAGTNSYEIATRITARVPRIYIRGGDAVAIEHLLLGESYP